MAPPSATGRGKNVPDEEFTQALYKGGELLSQGKLPEARTALEKAFELQPKNEKSQNLLGLAYFKSGMFVEAARVYELLVRENPADPTLRVNLGLVHLKSNQLPKAIKEFETAVDLAPDHKKGHNYLGLALAQAGQFAKAKDHFKAAGSDAMAEKMAQVLAAAAQAGQGGGGDSTDAQLDAAFGPSDGGAIPPGDPAAPAPEEVQELRLDEAIQEEAQGEQQEGYGAEMIPQEGHPQNGYGDYAQGEQLQQEAPQGEYAQQPYAQDPYAPQGEEVDLPTRAYGFDAPQEYAQPPQGEYAQPPQGEYAQPPQGEYAESQGYQEPAQDAYAETPAQDGEYAQEQGYAEQAPVAQEGYAEQAPQEGYAEGYGQENGAYAEPAQAYAEPQQAYAEPAQAYADQGGYAEQTPIPLTEAAPTQPRALVESDWGAQFGFDPASAPPPSNPFQAPAAASKETPDTTELVPPSQDDDEMRFALDEGPSAPPIDQTIPQSPRRDVALEVAAASPPEELGEAPVQAVSAFAAEPPPPHLVSPGAPPPTRPMTELPQDAQVLTGEVSAPFVVTSEVVTVTCVEEILVRCEGLVAVRGGVRFQPEPRRQRGRVTSEAFGEGAAQLQRVSGVGSLLLETGGRPFVVVALKEHPAYFREEAVFGFEEALSFENGRITSDVAPEVALVHLSGEGQVLLRPSGRLKTLEVRMDAPVTVPLNHWVGWFGGLTPRIVPMPFAVGGKSTPGVELSGQGFALLTTRDG